MFMAFLKIQTNEKWSGILIFPLSDVADYKVRANFYGGIKFLNLTPPAL
jgi:hypothetical protein